MMRQKKPTSPLLFALILCAAAAAIPAQSFGMLLPVQQDHSKHEEMEKRGNQGMGFDQDKITHHFLLRKDGGAI